MKEPLKRGLPSQLKPLFARFVIQGKQSVVVLSQPKIIIKKQLKFRLIRLSTPDMELPGYLRPNKRVLSVVTITVSYIRRLLKRLPEIYVKGMQILISVLP